MNLQSILNINLGNEELFCEAGTENCSGFYLGEEVLKTLRHQIVEDIAKKISTPQITALKEIIKEQADAEALKTVEEAARKSCDETKIYYPSYGDVTVSKWLELKLIDLLKDRKINDVIAKIAEETVAKLKENYDMFYAMQLLKKMSQAGMLKDDSIVKDFKG